MLCFSDFLTERKDNVSLYFPQNNKVNPFCVSEVILKKVLVLEDIVLLVIETGIHNKQL